LVSHHHRAEVLSLEGSTEHSVLTPLTIPVSGLRSTHGIVLSFCYLSLVHPLPPAEVLLVNENLVHERVLAGGFGCQT